MGLLSFFGPLWALQLQPASFRGVEFGVFENAVSVGRRTVIHEYPGSEARPYVEDLGLAREEIRLTGFLVGDDVYAQRDTLSKLLTTPGPGTLVHPSLGSLPTATLISASFGENFHDGRMVALELSFVLAAPRAYPSLYPIVSQNSLKPSTQGALNTVVSAIKNFLDKVTAFIDKAIAAVKAFLAPIIAVLSALAPFAGLIMGVIGIAMAAISAVRGVAFGQPDMSLGRYSQGNIQTRRTPQAGVQSAGAVLAAATTNAISGACTARAAVVSALATTTALAAASDPAFPQAVADLVEAARVMINDPHDQINALLPLAVYQPPASLPSTAPISVAINSYSQATAALCRRCAIASISNACAAYQPTSSTEVQALVSRLLVAFDAEIVFAADSGDLDTYLQLKLLRTSTIGDLQSRGSQLPSLIRITRNRPLPSLVLAQQLYQDSTRSDDLLARSNAPNGCFLPLQFQALAA